MPHFYIGASYSNQIHEPIEAVSYQLLHMELEPNRALSSRCLAEDGSWMPGPIQQPLGEPAGIPSPFPATQPNFLARYGDVSVSFPSHRPQLSSWRTSLLRRTGTPGCLLFVQQRCQGETWLVRRTQRVRAPLDDGDTRSGRCPRDEADCCRLVRAARWLVLTRVSSSLRMCENSALEYAYVFHQCAFPILDGNG